MSLSFRKQIQPDLLSIINNFLKGLQKHNQNIKFDSTWIVSDQKYLKKYADKEMIELFLQSIDSWNLHQFIQTDLMKPNSNLLLSINHIKFKSLQFLSIRGQQIQSIQTLAWLDAPWLQSIDLQDNDIMSLRVFSKTQLKQVNVINLSLNPCEYSELSNFSRCKAHNLMVLSCWFLYYKIKHEKGQDMYVEINSLLKFQSNIMIRKRSLEGIKVRSKLRNQIQERYHF